LSKTPEMGSLGLSY